MPDKASIIDAFFTYAQREQQREAEALIKEENLNEEAARRYIRTSLKREYATENGTELNETLPKLSPLNPHPPAVPVWSVPDGTHARHRPSRR